MTLVNIQEKMFIINEMVKYWFAHTFYDCTLEQDIMSLNHHLEKTDRDKNHF